MKKLLTLVLVLVLALGLTMPAMAFTSDTEEDADHPYDLKIYLVEYENNDLFGFATLPESDRGYAKNEIVAAVIELSVPEDEDPWDDGMKKFEISGDNVNFNVTDLPIRGEDAPPLVSDGEDGWYYEITDNALAGEDTYKWLVFAKVTDDEASITATLYDGKGVQGFSDGGKLQVKLDGTPYVVNKLSDCYVIVYDDDTIKTLPGDEEVGIYLFIDEDDNSTTGMAIDLNLDVGDSKTTATALGVNTKNELGIWDGTTLKTDGDLYDDIMDIYNDVVVDVFGLDYFLIGNYLRDSFFEDLVSGDTISATVDIEPWTAYVTVPDNIVVDPPKTGDAASIMGFVMVALSGAGVVALRKRG